MLAKLAFRNVRRSVRDYAIYFVTLVFGVAVFYAFNSVTGQSILFDLEDTATASVFEMTGQMLGMFSVVIACVLGFLVLYANGFLIRRRKQEFGTYLMLGMNPSSVSVIVLLETVAVGLVSLGVGLALGFALSQGLSFVTAGLFNIQMEQYRFVFSTNAFLLTLGCFVLIFAVTGLFNTLSIRRYKLIDLLSARSKNARFRVRNPWISLVGFLAAVAVIAWSYVTLVDNGLMQFDEGFWRATALMVAGTFLFFWSLAGFALAAIERTRGIYFKGLAMFTTRQIASKVNTAFVSLSVVCIMLFFSLTVFSTGMGLARAFSGNVEEGTLYDATLTANVYLNAGGIHDEEALASMSEEDREYQRVADEKAAAIAADAEAYDWDIAAKLADASPTWDALVDRSVQVDVYVDADESYGAIMDRYGKDTGNDKQNEAMHRQGISLVGVSQFNALAELTGRPTVDVGEDGYAVNNTLDGMQGLAEALAGKGETIQAAGRTLTSTGELRRQPLEDAAFASSGAEAIVPDSVIADLRAQPHVQDEPNRRRQAARADAGRGFSSQRRGGGFGVEVRPEALAGDALVHSRGGGRPVERHEHDDLVPGTVHRLRVPYRHGCHSGHPAAVRDQRLAGALPGARRDRLRPPYDLPVAARAGARVLPRSSRFGRVPYRMRRRRHQRCGARAAGRFGTRARADDRRADRHRVRGVSPGHALRQPQHHPRFAWQEAVGLGRGAGWRPRRLASGPPPHARCRPKAAFSA